MEGYKVCKFGGTSLANAEQMKKAAEIVMKDDSRRYVVVSAPGKLKDDEKITDHLINFATQGEHLYEKKNIPWNESAQKIEKRFSDLEVELGIADNRRCANITYRLHNKLYNITKGGKKLKINCKAYEDRIKALGEEYSARIFAEYLAECCGKRAHFVGLEDMMLVTDDFGDAKPLPEAYEKLAALKYQAQNGEILVIPGFYGYTWSGKVATFSRGGSDLTGAIIANAVNASVYENWTDVDGIRAADPRIVKGAEQIKELTYKELRELSYMGFNVFHQEAMIPAMKKHIPINVRNTNNCDDPGTMIVHSRMPDEKVVTGIACKKGFAVFRVEKLLMDNEIGFGEKLLRIFREEQVSFEHMPSGVDSLCVIAEQNQFDTQKVNRIVRRINEELHADEVDVRYNKALVIAVGNGMEQKQGVASRLCNSFTNAGVNIEMIDQGSSELSVIFGVDQKGADDAVRALYKEFFEKK